MSFRANLIKKIISIELGDWAEGSLEEQRARQEKAARLVPLPRDIVSRPEDVSGIPAVWIEPPQPGDLVILYLHGGAYALGSFMIYREMLSRVAAAAQSRCLAINYRLAPEHPFPAALEDAVTAYRWLFDQGTPPGNILIAGDSAGGGLTLAALIHLRDGGDPLPAGGICLSPWTDLTLRGDSVQQKADLDPILSPDSLKKYAGMYANGRPLTEPLISPLYADLRGLPPLLIQVGTDEILLSDAARVAEKARAAGGDVTLSRWEEMFHVFHLIPFLPETQQALDQISAFAAEAVNGGRHKNPA
jgi:acetyl esterase/lipase